MPDPAVVVFEPVSEGLAPDTRHQPGVLCLPPIRRGRVKTVLKLSEKPRQVAVYQIVLEFGNGKWDERREP